MNVIVPDSCIYIGSQFSGAVFSRDQLYRYLLWRRWSLHLPVLVFTMLNPSVANAIEDDRTITRCRGFANDHSYGGIAVVNAFGFVSTKPKVMFAAADPVGPDNDAIIRQVVANADVVLAHGPPAAHLGRDVTLLVLMQSVGARTHVLRLTSSGYPEHPLYLPKSCRMLAYP